MGHRARTSSPERLAARKPSTVSTGAPETWRARTAPQSLRRPISARKPHHRISRMPLPVVPHRSSSVGEADEPTANRHTVARYARRGDASGISARAKFARARLHRCRCDPALAPHVTDTPEEPSGRPVRPPPMERAASVGLDNPPGGPGKGPETPDKPTPPRTGDKPPADASGTSQTPRIDSYVTAGHPVPGRPETSTEQRGDRGAPANGSSTDSSSAGPAGEKPRTPGDPPAEADPKSEKEPETGKTEVGSPAGEERDHDDAGPAQTGDGGPEAEKPGQPKTENPRQDEGERGNDDRGSETDQPEPGKAEGQDGGKDNGSAPDDPATSEQPSTGPSEASQFPPGSRRASLATSRAMQLENAEELRAIFQDAQSINGPGEGTTGESGDSGAPPQSENAGSDERGPEAQPQGTDTPPGATGDGDSSTSGDASGGNDASSGRDQPAPVTSGVEAEPPAQETPRPQDQGQEPPLPQDSSGSGNDSGDPPVDPPTDGSPPADDQPRDGNDGTPPGSEVDEPTDPVTETGPATPEPGREAPSTGPENTDQGTEPPAPKADDGTTGNETDNPKPADGTTPPPEGTGENVTPPEDPAKQSDGHGTDTEGDGSGSDPEGTDESQPEGRHNPIISDVYTDSQGQVHVEPRYGREQTDESGSEPESPAPAELPTRGDLDPVGALGGEPGRGELRDPEEDPAERDPEEPDPERSSRRKDLLKETMEKSEDIVDVGDKALEDAFKALNSKPPKSHPCTARDTSAHMDPEQTPAKAGSVAIALIGTAIIVTQATRWTTDKVREFRRREHADD